MQKLLEIWKSWSEEGLKLPFVYDATTKGPSITLGLLYLTSLVMLISLVSLHFASGILTATLVSVMVWVLAYVFYRLRKLDKVKFDLDDKSIELDGSDEEQK